MRIRFFVDPDSGELEITKHGVSEEEVHDVFESPDDDLPSRNGTCALYGRTSGGRWLKVIYTEGDEQGDYFVLTAYPPTPRATKALRRRLRKKQ